MKTLRIISGSLLAASLGCVATAQAAPTSATLAVNFIAAGGSTVSGTVGSGDLVTLGALTTVKSLSVSAVAGESGSVTASGGLADGVMAASVAGTANQTTPAATVTATEGITDSPATLVFESQVTP